MGDGNSKKFLCPKCGKKELENVNGGFKCRNCGYTMHEEPRHHYLDKLQLIPALVYGLVAFILCIYIVWDVCYFFLRFYCPNNEFMIEFISRAVLYMLLSLAILDLTALVKSQYVDPFTRIPIDESELDEKELEHKKRELIKDDRRYITKLITISVVLILMHIFHTILIHPDNIDISVGECIIGTAAVLVAVGVWKVLDSKSD